MGVGAVRIIQLPQAPQYELRGINIDLSRKTGVLIRQSKKGADLDSRESRLRQESLVPVAITLRGDTDGTNIILYDEGSGVSGTKGYDQRPQLSRLYLDIANGVIGSIVVARADRLFRDKHFRNVSMFTEIAERQRIILIVPGRAVYDFTKTRDLQAFQREMQEAYSYIATQVAYMHDTRLQKIQRGRYGGGNLPAPYAIDRSVGKDQQVPVIYRPWQPIVIDLFERFRDFDFIVARIARYIEEQPYIFPYPSSEDLQIYMFKTLMRKVSGGYTFSSGDSITKYFSNLALGGYAKIGKDGEGNTLFLANAFEPAVPMDLLGVSYAAITGHYPDGTPFGRKKFTIRSRGVPGMESPAVLHGLLESDDGMVFYRSATKNSRPFYGCNRDMGAGTDGLSKAGWAS
jgi:DNA invertase Pin-like site-specific DNA recombinase